LQSAPEVISSTQYQLPHENWHAISREIRSHNTSLWLGGQSDADNLSLKFFQVHQPRVEVLSILNVAPCVGVSITPSVEKLEHNQNQG